MSLYALKTSGQLRPALSQEWLLTNGIGGFSSSTVVGCNTRRYHGLLVAATAPPVGRIVALSRVAERLTFKDKNVTHDLSINQFQNRDFFPRGDQYLREFELGDLAEWRYAVEGATVIKQLQLLRDRNAVGLRYSIDPGGKPLGFEIKPFLALRDFHSLARGTDRSFNVVPGVHRAVVTAGNLMLQLRCTTGVWRDQPDWWKDHFYAIEAERGQDCLEDLFSPGVFAYEISAPATFTLWASTDALEEIDWDGELAARQARHFTSAPQTRTVEKLMRAADDFVVARKNPDGTPGQTIIAGYPWFTDWGRDTMISLPGLLLATGRFDEARAVLSVFAQYVSQGMIPNRFGDYDNVPEYNTVDASLWFIHACFEYRAASGDDATHQSLLLPACHAIIDGYCQGTRYGIVMDPDDGLITQGDASTQLTWMDAKFQDHAFTPRQGKAVEINALWFNALKLLKRDDLAETVRKSFVNAFWISPFRGLYDVIDRDTKDNKVRPNQIFAASLPYSPLDDSQQAAVVETVRRELLTPFGLRTLAPDDPLFHRFYRGDQFHRDEAYHNGTIWPWLIGPFIDAYLRVNRESAAAKAQAREWLSSLIEAMENSGWIGQIAEIHEAEPPHRPVGCGAQAWSVAEVLRLAIKLGM